VALGAGLLDGEKSLLHAHLALAVAGGAGLGLGAGLRPRAVAGRACIHGGNADLGLGAVRRRLQRDLEVVAQIGAAVDVRAAAARLAEDVAEDVAEGIGKVREPGAVGAGCRRRIDARMAVTVVGGALVGIGEHLVGFLRFLEFVLCAFALVLRIAVRMVLHREFAVRFLDRVVFRVAIDAQNLVVVSFGHMRL